MSKKRAFIHAGRSRYVAVIRAAQMTAELTLIVKSNVGATRLIYGCIPVKILIKTADLLDNIIQARDSINERRVWWKIR